MTRTGHGKRTKVGKEIRFCHVGFVGLDKELEV